MKLITNKDGDLFSRSDNINENDIPILERLADQQPQTRNTPQQKRLNINHTGANKDKPSDIKKLEYIVAKVLKTLPKT